MTDFSSWEALVPYLLAALAGIILFLFLWRFFRKKPPESRYVEALNALLEGNEDKALDDLRQTVQVDQSNIDAYLRLGKLLRRKGEIERALRIHRDLDVGTFFRRKLTPAEKFRIREAIADDLLAGRRSTEALTVLADLLKLDKANRKIRSKMVALYERNGEWNHAFRLYREGIRIRKENAPDRVARYRAFCGASLLAAGNKEEAAKVFQDALRIDPSCPEALFRMGDLRFDEEELDEAIGYWKQFHKISPDQAFLTFEKLERALYEAGDLNSVEPIYQAILENDPNDEQTLIALSTFYTRRGQADEAIAMARRAAEKHPEATDAQEHYLMLLSESDEESGALDNIREYLKSRRPRVTEFVCSRCNHSSDDPFWRCPKCLNWNTAKLIRRIRQAASAVTPPG